MADSTDFLDLFIEEMGSLNKGSLRLTEQNIKFHHDNTGNILNLNANDLQSIKWQRLGNRHGIKFIFQDGKKYRIGGFKETDFDKLNGFSKNRWEKEIEKIDLSLKGWNYGDCNVDGQSVEFAVDGKPCFEVPLSNVSNAVANKNEAVLEFHQNDDCPVALIEMRFHIPTNEDDTTDPVEEFRKAVLAYAGIETDSGQAIATLNQILCTTPRGRYDIKVYPNNLSLHGKTYDYKIPIKTIQRLFLVPHKDGRHMYFVCSLAPPIRQGQTRYHYLVFEFVKDEEMEIELGLTEDQLKQQYGEKLQRNLEGPVYEIVCKLFRVLVGMKVTTPGKFVGHSGTPAIVCAHRQTSGFLYPLEKGFLYIHKPPMYIRFDEISTVHFARSDVSTRSFDFEVEMKSGTNLVFNSVEKEEYSKLYDYVQGKSLRIRNAKKVESLRNTDMFADSDEEHDPYKEHVKKEGKDREAERNAGIDDESDPEDEDYDLDDDLAKRRKEREQNSSEGSESEPTEEWDSSGSDVVKESDMDENDDGSQKKVKKEKKKREKKSKDDAEGEGRRKKRAKKDPNAPKRATTAYMLWLNENRAEIKKEGDTVADTAKRGGEMWKAMGEDDKRPWEEKAAKDKERYEEEMREWRKNGGASTSTAGKTDKPEKSNKPAKVTKATDATTTKSPSKAAKSREYVETSDSSESEDEPLEKLKEKKKTKETKETKEDRNQKPAESDASKEESSAHDSDSD